MRKYAALFRTQDGVSIDGIDMPVWIVKNDKPQKTHQLCLSLQEPSANGHQTVLILAGWGYDRAEMYVPINAKEVSTVKDLFSTERAAWNWLAEKHMQTALEFTRKAAQSGGAS